MRRWKSTNASARGEVRQLLIACSAVKMALRMSGFNVFICSSDRCWQWKSSRALRTTIATSMASSSVIFEGGELLLRADIGLLLAAGDPAILCQWASQVRPLVQVGDDASDVATL